MRTLAIRGAITVDENTPGAILEATQALLQTMLDQNRLSQDEIVALFFSATLDLDAVYPAQAARNIGLTQVPMMCFQEMAVPSSLPRCIRVLALCELSSPRQLKHVYLREARSLRPDWAES